MRKSTLFAALFLFSASVSPVQGVRAQDTSAPLSDLPPQPVAQQQELQQSSTQQPAALMTIREKAAIEGKDVNISAIPTLLFTPDEYKLLQEAKARFVTRPPDSGDLNEEWVQPGDPGIREIALAGIVYRAPKEWTIWLNEQRVTPDAIPSEVLDLRVFKDFIELKWYDAYTNQIFPIRIRPHQRFNLDNRLFLPG